MRPDIENENMDMRLQANLSTRRGALPSTSQVTYSKSTAVVNFDPTKYWYQQQVKIKNNNNNNKYVLRSVLPDYT
jgi:hypothetical protein